MPDDKAFDPMLVEFLVVASLSAEIAHMINNLLGVGPVRLKFVLDYLDKLDIPSDERRKIERLIGIAIDDMQMTLKLTSLFGRLSWQGERDGMTLIKMIQDIVGDLAPLAHRHNYTIGVKSLSEQHSTKIYGSFLGRIILNVLIFSISQYPPTLGELYLIIRETDILITSDNPIFSDLIHTAFNYETEDDLLKWEYLNLFTALKMAREMSGDIQITEIGGKSAIAIQVP